jgi:hypothetical protein
MCGWVEVQVPTSLECNHSQAWKQRPDHRRRSRLPKSQPREWTVAWWQLTGPLLQFGGLSLSLLASRIR